MYAVIRRSWTAVGVAVCLGLFVEVARAAEDVWSSAPASRGGAIVFRTAIVEDAEGNPAAAGKSVGEKLKQAMGETPLKAVVLSECFEDRQQKEKLLAGVCSVLPKDIVVGGATYGSFTQADSLGFDAVGLLGVGGDGVAVSAALTTNMGARGLALEQQADLIAKRLTAAGTQLGRKLPKGEDARLMIVLCDAHYPTNQYVVDGVQEAVGKQFPITGGSVNKNAGQTFVYFGGRIHQDSAMAVMLSGDFQVALVGRRADDNDGIIRTAKESAANALAKLQGEPIAMLAFNCGGRRGRLNNVADELAAFQSAVGAKLPLFGCYCAGEIGPVDSSEKKPGVLSGGGGWHVMVTAVGRRR